MWWNQKLRVSPQVQTLGLIPDRLGRERKQMEDFWTSTNSAKGKEVWGVKGRGWNNKVSL
jgi:hypothetical protein